MTKKARQPSLFQQGQDLPLFSQPASAPAFRPEEMHEQPGPCDRCGHLPIRGECLCPGPASLGADAPDDPPGELFSRVQEATESRKPYPWQDEQPPNFGICSPAAREE